MRLYLFGYRRIMNTIIRTGTFDGWLSKLRDTRGKARIFDRIRSAERGNFGDCVPVGEGVSEMRIHSGPGYRVYFTQDGDVIYVLLCGGTKRSQRRDIVRAKELARILKGK